MTVGTWGWCIARGLLVAAVAWLFAAVVTVGGAVHRIPQEAGLTAVSIDIRSLLRWKVLWLMSILGFLAGFLWKYRRLPR